MQIRLASNDTNKIFHQLYMHWHNVTFLFLPVMWKKGTMMHKKLKNNSRNEKQDLQQKMS